MSELFSLCRRNDWDQVLKLVQEDPCLGVTLMTMDNHIQTTLLHQAITSKGDVEARAKVVEYVLEHTPSAASIKNGYGSLPLHVIAQRNTHITSSVKEKLIVKMIEAYDQALVEEGGTGRRTPLHIIFTGKFPAKERIINKTILRLTIACLIRRLCCTSLGQHDDRTWAKCMLQARQERLASCTCGLLSPLFAR